MHIRLLLSLQVRIVKEIVFFGDVNPQNFLLASLDKIGAAKKCGTDSRGTDSRGTDFSVPHLFENPEMLKSVPWESVPHFFAAPIL